MTDAPGEAMQRFCQLDDPEASVRMEALEYLEELDPLALAENTGV